MPPFPCNAKRRLLLKKISLALGENTRRPNIDFGISLHEFPFTRRGIRLHSSNSNFTKILFPFMPLNIVRISRVKTNPKEFLYVISLLLEFRFPILFLRSMCLLSYKLEKVFTRYSPKHRHEYNTFEKM
jgi:hypothetical protein